jgi:hypothetical protein
VAGRSQPALPDDLLRTIGKQVKAVKDRRMDGRGRVSCRAFREFVIGQQANSSQKLLFDFAAGLTW